MHVFITSRLINQLLSNRAWTYSWDKSAWFDCLLVQSFQNLKYWYEVKQQTLPMCTSSKRFDKLDGKETNVDLLFIAVDFSTVFGHYR